jgi:hypothetical protein
MYQREWVVLLAMLPLVFALLVMRRGAAHARRPTGPS